MLAWILIPHLWTGNESSDLTGLDTEDEEVLVEEGVTGEKEKEEEGEAVSPTGRADLELPAGLPIVEAGQRLTESWLGRHGIRTDCGHALICGHLQVTSQACIRIQDTCKAGIIIQRPAGTGWLPVRPAYSFRYL